MFTEDKRTIQEQNENFNIEMGKKGKKHQTYIMELKNTNTELKKIY